MLSHALRQVPGSARIPHTGGSIAPTMHVLHVHLATGKVVLSHCKQTAFRRFAVCTLLKATGLLSCLQMKIASFGMKPKWMQHLREVQLEILGAVLSLLRWTMLLREDSACQLCSLSWLVVAMTARVKRSRTKRVPIACDGLKDMMAVRLTQTSVSDDGLSFS